jgi:UDP-N-acetyl-2-amino-2-deoxyglucuronate dehydrogenase
MKDIINFALVGCGRISKKNHFDALSKLKNDARLVAVCDIDESRARKAGEENSVDFYTSYEEMLQRDDIDAVSICTPSGLHPVHGITAARRKASCHYRETHGDKPEKSRRAYIGL